MSSSSSVPRVLRGVAVPRGLDTLHAVVAEPAGRLGHAVATVVLAHGAGGSHLNFYRQIDTLSESYRVIAWDQRGFGASTGPTRVPEPDQSAEDLLAVLDHLIGPTENNVHLVGQSLGGWALAKAVTSRRRPFASLTLTGSVGGMLTPATRRSLQVFVDSTRAAAGAASTIGRSAALAASASDQVRPDTVLFQLLGLLPSPGVSAVEKLLDCTVDPAALAATGTPVLFILGELDTIFAPDDVSTVAQRLPAAEFSVITGAGHSPYFERPDEFNTTLTRFLRKVDSTRTR